MYAENDLSGDWLGRYRFPISVPAVSFEAVLVDVDGSITGTIQEIDNNGVSLTATVQGHRDGTEFHFLKIYDASDDEYDYVAYTGQIASDGTEVNGQWTIPNDWSGDFIMVRKKRSTRSIETTMSVEIKV